MCDVNVLTMPVDYLFFNFIVIWFLINLVLCCLITRGDDNQSLWLFLVFKTQNF